MCGVSVLVGVCVFVCVCVCVYVCECACVCDIYIYHIYKKKTGHGVCCALNPVPVSQFSVIVLF